MTATTDTMRQRALRLLEAGLVTISEAATLARTSRQLVLYWCKREGIDATKARRRYVRELWRLN